MKIKRILSMLVLLAALSVLGAAAYQYQQQSPAHTLQQAGEAIERRDEKAFAAAVTTDTLLEAGYDEGASLLSENIEALHAQYPADPFFDHSPEFMRQYTTDHRSQSLNFMEQTLHEYFSGPNPELSFEDDRAQWLAAQLVKFRQSCRPSVSKIEEKGDTAYATIVLAGDNTPYGQLLDQTEIVLELKRSSGTWRITRIANGRELLSPAVKGAEDFWTLQGWQ